MHIDLMLILDDDMFLSFSQNLILTEIHRNIHSVWFEMVILGIRVNIVSKPVNFHS